MVVSSDKFRFIALCGVAALVCHEVPEGAVQTGKQRDSFQLLYRVLTDLWATTCTWTLIGHSLNYALACWCETTYGTYERRKPPSCKWNVDSLAIKRAVAQFSTHAGVLLLQPYLASVLMLVYFHYIFPSYDTTYPFLMTPSPLRLTVSSLKSHAGLVGNLTSNILMLASHNSSLC